MMHILDDKGVLRERERKINERRVKGYVQKDCDYTIYIYYSNIYIYIYIYDNGKLNGTERYGFV